MRLTQRGYDQESPAGSLSRVRVLVVDNYDSFVFNLVQYLGQLRCRRGSLAQRRPAVVR